MTHAALAIQERARTLRAQAAVLASLADDCERAGESLHGCAVHIDADLSTTETEVARAESIIADVRAKMERTFAMRRELSPRQREVLRLVAHGKTNKEIADTLKIAFGTVALHVRAACLKLNVRSRAAAVFRAFVK